MGLLFCHSLGKLIRNELFEHHIDEKHLIWKATGFCARRGPALCASASQGQVAAALRLADDGVVLFQVFGSDDDIRH